MKNIVVVGSCNVDLVLSVENMPKKGQTIHGKCMKKVAGGKGANQACACGKLHGQCVFLSAVGCDDSAELVLDSLKNSNVNTDAIHHCSDLPSGTAVITVDAAGENSIVVVSGANSACNMSYFMKHKDILMASDYVLTQLETPLDDIYGLLKLLKKMGKTLILNPAPAPESIPDDVLQAVDFLTPNETELEKLTGFTCQTEEQVKKAAGVCLEKGVKNVLVTLGDKGAMLINSDKMVFVPAYQSKAVDTTAAGDTFNGAFVTALAEGYEVESAIRFANAASAISVTRNGAQPSIPFRQEVMQFMKERG